MNEESECPFISHFRIGRPSVLLASTVFSEEEVRKEGREGKNETRCPLLRLELHPVMLYGTIIVTRPPDGLVLSCGVG